MKAGDLVYFKAEFYGPRLAEKLGIIVGWERDYEVWGAWRVWCEGHTYLATSKELEVLCEHKSCRVRNS